MLFDNSFSSSMIAAVGYDAKCSLLFIMFRSDGSVYEYSNVPATTLPNFLSAPSKGQHFLSHIKPAYAARKLTDAESHAFRAQLAPPPTAVDSDPWLVEMLQSSPSSPSPVFF